MLHEATASQYPHSEEKLEIICNVAPIDLQIETSQAKFAHKIFLRGDSCTTTLKNSSSQISSIMKRRHAKFCQDTGLTGLQEYTPAHCKKVQLHRWNKRLSLTFPEYPPMRVQTALLPEKMDRRSIRDITAMICGQNHLLEFQHQIAKTYSPFCICGTRENATHFLFNCIYYRNLREKHNLNFEDITEMYIEATDEDWWNLATFISSSSRL